MEIITNFQPHSYCQRAHKTDHELISEVECIILTNLAKSNIVDTTIYRNGTGCFVWPALAASAAFNNGATCGRREYELHQLHHSYSIMYHNPL